MPPLSAVAVGVIVTRRLRHRVLSRVYLGIGGGDSCSWFGLLLCGGRELHQRDQRPKDSRALRLRLQGEKASIKRSWSACPLSDRTIPPPAARRSAPLARVLGVAREDKHQHLLSGRKA